jgi:hypothetical protein
MKWTLGNKRYFVWTAVLVLIVYLIFYWWWFSCDAAEGYEVVSTSKQMLAHDATHNRPLRGTLPTGNYTMSMALYDGSANPMMGNGSSGDVSGHVYTVSTDGTVLISDMRAPAPFQSMTTTSPPTGPPMACYPITPTPSSSTPSSSTPWSTFTPTNTSSATNKQGFTPRMLYEEGFEGTGETIATGTGGTSAVGTGGTSATGTSGTTPTPTSPSGTWSTNTTRSSGIAISDIVGGAPKDATIDTFYIDYFSADNTDINQTRLKTVPYRVSTAMTFAVAGMDFLTADIVLSGGEYGATGVSLITGKPFIDSTTSTTPSNNPSIITTMATTMATTSAATTSAATTSAATTMATTSAATTKASSSSPPTSGPLSQSVSIQYVTSNQSYRFDQNTTYTINLVLYTESGIISASKCRNTVLQIVPSLSNNSNNFFNYTFYINYLLIGGGGGGGSAGGNQSSVIGGAGQGGLAGAIQEDARFITSSATAILPKTRPRVVPEPIITYSRLTTGTSRLSQIGVPGGKGGKETQSSNMGLPGEKGIDAQIQCNQYLSDGPIVAKGGAGGSGGKANVNSQQQYNPQGTSNDSQYKLGWGGDGGRIANDSGVDGNTGIIDLDLYYFVVTGGSDVNIITPTPPACPVVTCAAPRSMWQTTPTPDTSETSEWEFDWILSILGINRFTMNPSDATQLAQFIQQFVAIFPVPPYTQIAVDQLKLAATTIYNMLPLVRIGEFNTNLGSTTVTKSGDIITLRPSAPPLRIIPDSKYASYPAWQFQYTHSVESIGLLSKYMNDLYNPTNGTLLPISKEAKQVIVLPFEIQNNLNSQLSRLNFQNGSTAAPSANYCLHPQNSNAYNLAYDYAADGFWVPVHLFLSMVTISGSTQSVQSDDLNVWYLFVGTDGVIRGLYAYPNNERDVTKPSVSQRPSTEFQLFNTNPTNVTADLFYTIYLPYTDGVIRYSNN